MRLVILSACFAMLAAGCHSTESSPTQAQLDKDRAHTSEAVLRAAAERELRADAGTDAP
jgi:hypothetical protein